MNLKVLGLQAAAGADPVGEPGAGDGADPVHERLLYPTAQRLGFPLTPLRRMTVGLVLASLATAVIALIQGAIDRNGPGTVSVRWQFPAYFLLTMGEVMVSITGLEFAYSQAPRRMKSTIMGLWLLTVTLGNVFVAAISLTHLPAASIVLAVRGGRRGRRAAVRRARLLLHAPRLRPGVSGALGGAQRAARLPPCAASHASTARTFASVPGAFVYSSRAVAAAARAAARSSPASHSARASANHVSPRAARLRLAALPDVERAPQRRQRLAWPLQPGQRDADTGQRVAEPDVIGSERRLPDRERLLAGVERFAMTAEGAEIFAPVVVAASGHDPVRAVARDRRWRAPDRSCRWPSPARHAARTAPRECSSTAATSALSPPSTLRFSAMAASSSGLGGRELAGVDARLPRGCSPATPAGARARGPCASGCASAKRPQRSPSSGRPSMMADGPDEHHGRARPRPRRAGSPRPATTRALAVLG